jgi:Ca2+-binding EF-hand superfamily protein
MGACLACLNSRERDEVALRFATTRAALNIKEPDFWRLYRVFKKANKSESGKMSYEEFVERIDVEAHGLSKRLYDLFCGHAPGGIGFKLFAILSWNLCTSDADSLSVFAFLCYDRRGEGRLGEHTRTLF